MSRAQSRARAPPVERGVRGGDDRGVLRQPEVVVRRERHDRPPVGRELALGPGRVEVARLAPLPRAADRRGLPLRPLAPSSRQLTRAPDRWRPRASPTMRSSSGVVIVSGGMSTTTSPSGRSSTPRSTAAAHTRRPQRSAVGRRRELDAAHEPAAAAPPGPRRAARCGRRAARAAPRSGRARWRARRTPRAARGGAARPRPRARSRCRSGRGTACARTRSGPRNASKTRRSPTVADIREVPGGEALAEAQQVGAQPALLRREQRAGASEAGRDLVADRAARRARGTRAASGASASAGASCMPAAPCTSGSTITAASSSRVLGDHAAAAARSSRARRTRGARSTGNRSGSKTSVPKPPSPTDSAPMVSPWYAPPNARNVVRPVTPRFTQYWNAIFSACSTRAAPSDANRKCGSSTGTTGGERLGAARRRRGCRCRASSECAPRSSCSRSASSSSGTWWPSVLTHSDEIASR